MNSDDHSSDNSAAAPAAGAPARPTLNEQAPAVQAMRILQQLIVDARRDPQHKVYAEMDLRKMNELQVKLASNVADPDAVQWLRQMALGWNTKLRGNPALRFRRMLDLIEQVRR